MAFASMDKVEHASDAKRNLLKTFVSIWIKVKKPPAIQCSSIGLLVRLRGVKSYSLNLLSSLRFFTLIGFYLVSAQAVGGPAAIGNAIGQQTKNLAEPKQDTGASVISTLQQAISCVEQNANDLCGQCGQFRSTLPALAECSQPTNRVASPFMKIEDPGSLVKRDPSGSKPSNETGDPNTTGNEKAKGNPSSERGTPTADNSGGGNPQQCYQAAQRAAAACGSQGGSAGGGGGGGLNSLAGSLSGATYASSRANADQAALCGVRRNECMQACQQTDQQQAQYCNSLQNQMKAMSDQAQNNLGDMGKADQSAQASSSDPGYDGEGDTARSEALKELENRRAATGFSEPQTRKTADDFNVDNSPTTNSAYAGNGGTQPQNQRGGGGATIPNNSGTQLGGAGGGSPAQLGGQGGAGMAPQGGVSTDIMQGERGGGGYQYHTGPGSIGDSDFSQRGGRGPASAQKGMDLRKYLPGGELYNNQRRMGGFDPMSSQINGPHVNMWERISTRFIERCRLGRMLDCR